MKKLIALLLMLTMLFSVATLFAGCEDDSSKKKSSSKQDEEEDEEEETEEESTEGQETEDENIETTAPTEEPTEPVTPTEPTEPAEYEFDDTDGNGPLLYRVSDDEGNVIWLFGSIHVGREDYYPLPEYVMDAFEGSDALAVEADIMAAEQDQELLMQLAMLSMYTDGSTISDHLSEDVYDQAVAILTECGQYNPMLDYFMPFLWSQTIDNFTLEKTGADSTLGIDLFFLTQAKETGMEILEVESTEFQYEIFTGFSQELQILLLESSVYNYLNPSEYKETLQEMMDIWYCGNESVFTEYLAKESDYPEEFSDYENLDILMEEYDLAIKIERNQSMTEYAIDALESGEEIFICVGAAHVVGEDAMADNLRELGYTVEIIR